MSKLTEFGDGVLVTLTREETYYAAMVGVLRHVHSRPASEWPEFTDYELIAVASVGVFRWIAMMDAGLESSAGEHIEQALSENSMARAQNVTWPLQKRGN